MKNGISLIAKERARQLSEEGWTANHDDRHRKGELERAAQCYSAVAYEKVSRETPVPLNWPWNSQWWKPAGRVRTLVKAGALFMAEAERLERLGEGFKSKIMRSEAHNCAERIDFFRDKKRRDGKGAAL